ncbi:MAG: hypothetical protein ABSF66_04445 [Terriglobales bacterium]|jgi:hypothetical protein
MAGSAVAPVARWIARVGSILSMLAVFVFAVGEIAGGTGPRPTLQEWAGLALWPVGVCVGLVVAWYREELGGILALGCLIAFYVWNLLRSGHLPQGPFFFLIAAPALPFLIAGFLSHRSDVRRT